ncbi:RND transporter, partial [Candidatus Endoriftia persephone str. Guaymas]|nr:RND transporter [Candidatus Endoriftia persephone str. Guaymas]
MYAKFMVWLLPALLIISGVSGVSAAELPSEPAIYREIPREFRLDGTVEAINRTTVSAQTQGVVEQILVDVDDFVEKGMLIVLLNDTQHQAKLKQAQAELKEAVARLQ